MTEHTNTSPCPACVAETGPEDPRAVAVIRTMSDHVERLTLDLAHVREELAAARLALREHPAAVDAAEKRGERRGIARSGQIVGFMVENLRRDPRNADLVAPLVRAQAALGELSV